MGRRFKVGAVLAFAISVAAGALWLHDRFRARLALDMASLPQSPKMGPLVQLEARTAFVPDGRLVVAYNSRARTGDLTAEDVEAYGPAMLRRLHALRIWAPDNGRELSRLEGHLAPVLGVAVSPDGTRVVSAHQHCGPNLGEKELRLWDLAAGKEVWGLDVGVTVMAVAFSPDGRRVAAACGDVGDSKRVDIIDLERQAVVRTIDRGHWPRTHALRSRPGGTGSPEGAGAPGKPRGRTR